MTLHPAVHSQLSQYPARTLIVINAPSDTTGRAAHTGSSSERQLITAIGEQITAANGTQVTAIPQNLDGLADLLSSIPPVTVVATRAATLPLHRQLLWWTVFRETGQSLLIHDPANEPSTSRQQHTV
ncbi:hypothetical protein ACFPVT_07965 [Corynebacterium choanae]|uniref:Uncharacterized protein n=2 Tax=Corynebacterium choanae TaxID=1862358 RepID=A0A3G6JAU0_9CORY|nr:hypothetical protein [Corynebacterium choanae]AZA14048.1 hypothetical protein CCHOA_08295 [Corynebacterium choanae]